MKRFIIVVKYYLTWGALPEALFRMSALNETFNLVIYMLKCKFSRTIQCDTDLYYHMRAVLKKLYSKFDEFLAGVRNSTAIMASIFMRLRVANPRPLERFFRFIVLWVFYGEKNN